MSHRGLAGCRLGKIVLFLILHHTGVVFDFPSRFDFRLDGFDGFVAFEEQFWVRAKEGGRVTSSEFLDEDVLHTSTFASRFSSSCCVTKHSARDRKNSQGTSAVPGIFCCCYYYCCCRKTHCSGDPAPTLLRQGTKADP